MKLIRNYIDGDLASALFDFLQKLNVPTSVGTTWANDENGRDNKKFLFKFTSIFKRI